ncbi:MAG: hypothetical protein KAU21_04495, partial [Gammaproteobacteria bacterium]|nr:hypothetical protein [Gammaproteobacteria bacterium]
VWPPNHKYKNFIIKDFVSSVTDNCSELSLDDLLITQVTSNEPEDANGDGHTLNDIIISDDRKSVDIRSERQGGGEGRVYTVSIQATDESNNTRTEEFQLKVPHN